MKKFSSDALSKDTSKNPEITAIIRIIDGLSFFLRDGNSNQLTVLKLIEVVMPNSTSDQFEQNVLT